MSLVLNFLTVVAIICLVWITAAVAAHGVYTGYSAGVLQHDLMVMRRAAEIITQED